jgi:uncharacterized damage-inducible protein DinB
VNNLSEVELDGKPKDIDASRWTVLLHLVNHGTDHRSTILQKLTELGGRPDLRPGFHFVAVEKRRAGLKPPAQFTEVLRTGRPSPLKRTSTN